MNTNIVSSVVSEDEIPESCVKELNGLGHFDDCLKTLPENVFVPEDLSAFLDKGSEVYWHFKYGSGSRKPGTFGPAYIKTATKSTMKWIEVRIKAGTKNIYVGSGLNLISGATEYGAPGMLIYIPEIDSYGTHDIDHGVLNVFPGVGWSEIVENLGAYVSTQWQKPGKTTLHKKIPDPYAYKQLIRHPKKMMPIKLYKSTSEGILYWEMWGHSGIYTMHWGKLGDRGQSHDFHSSAFPKAAATVEGERKRRLDEGYREWPKLTQVVLQYRIEGMGNPKDLKKRHDIEDLMNETLGWTGLGHCDGGDIGKGTINVFCQVVDASVAFTPIRMALAQHNQLKGVAIAVDKEDGFELLWPKDFQGAFAYTYE